MDDVYAVADRVAFTPAERAVIAEQCETMKADLDVLLTACKEGTNGDVVRGYIPVTRANDYLGTIIGRKINAVMEADHQAGEHG